jgi:hypothetical protein
MARYNGTNGIQDTGITVDDSDNINMAAGTITFAPTVNSTLIDISANNLDLTWKLGHGTDDFGFYWIYRGTGSADANYLELTSENGTNTDFYHMRYHQETHVIDVNSSLFPSINNTYDLGKNTERWKDIYTSGDVSIGGNLTVTGTMDTVDKHTDVDTTTATPNLNEVLKWDGANWVPSEEGASFTFAITAFSDGISDTSQLIGSGVWLAAPNITFTASYDNEPGGMTAEVAMSGSAVAWGGNLSMTPTTGPETNTDDVEYPGTTGGTITFTLSQSADGTTDIESVTFNNTMRYGTNNLTQGNQTQASIQDPNLNEVAGPNESRNNHVISNIATDAGNYLTFAYADRLTDVDQVQMNEGYGYITVSFDNGDRTIVVPDVQTAISTVANSAGYSENFAAITSTDQSLTNGSNDFKLLENTNEQNYIYWGELNKDAAADGTNQYTESDVENNISTTDDGHIGSNTISSRVMEITTAVDEYVYIAYPSRLGLLSIIDIGGFDSITDFWIDAGSGTELVVTNNAGFREDYYVYVSKNPYIGLGSAETLTVSL